MNASIQNILKEYSMKKNRAEQEAFNRKTELINNNELLQNIEQELHILGISKSKYILENNFEKLHNLELNLSTVMEKKEKILNGLNISKEYFFPIYDCKLCNDTGYITNNDHSSTLCSCLTQKLYNDEYNKSNISNMKSQNFNFYTDKFYTTDVNPEKYKFNISPRDNITKIKNLCDNFIENFDNSEQKNLFFTGATGLGKTFLSSCIANKMIENKKNVLYQTSSVMFDEILNFRYGKNNQSKLLENILNVDLLIIDDLGTEYVTEPKITEFFNILNTRMINSSFQKKTIISTNLSLEQLRDTYKDRIFSRIIGNYDICYFTGDDIRLQLKLKK